MAMNMDYCRFENTLAALRECDEHFDDDVDALSSDRELKARANLLMLCKAIADSYADEIEELVEAKKQRIQAAKK